MSLSLLLLLLLWLTLFFIIKITNNVLAGLSNVVFSNVLRPDLKDLCVWQQSSGVREVRSTSEEHRN